MTNDPETLKNYITTLMVGNLNLCTENMALRATITNHESKLLHLENKINSLEQQLKSTGMADFGKTIQAVIASHTDQITSLNTKVEDAVKDWKINVDTQLNHYFAYQDDKAEQDKLANAVVINSPLFPSELNHTNCKATTLQIIQDHLHVSVPVSEIRKRIMVTREPWEKKCYAQISHTRQKKRPKKFIH